MARLLFITERFAPDIGGVAKSATRTAHLLGTLGYDVEVLCWSRQLAPGQLETTECAEKVRLHRMGLFANWDFSLQHTLNVIDYLGSQHAIDGVWGHYLYPAGFLAVLVGGMAKVPTIVSARGNDVDRLMFPPGDFARLQWTLQNADRIASVSHDLAKKIGVLVGQHDKIHVVHNSVDTATFTPGSADQKLRERLEIPQQHAILGFCGELRHKKGLPFIVSALHEMQNYRPTTLLVIGEIRPREQSQLHAYAADFPKLNSYLRVTGHLEDARTVREHLLLCDVVLQPSVWDGLPNAVLEAMACGKIVVGSEAGGIPEAIRHEASGFLLPCAQLHQLGASCKHVLELPQQRRDEISTAARDHVVSNFAGEREERALRELLSPLLGSQVS